MLKNEKALAGDQGRNKSFTNIVHFSGEKSSTNNIDFALEYQRLGFFILPLIPGQKRPYITWAHRADQMPSEDEVKSWWQQWPDAQIGCATGRSGLTVLDFDSADALPRFQATVHDIESPFVVTTGREGGGCHVYFSEAQGLNNVQSPEGHEMDVRTGNGIVVLPPSLHKSGRQYQWADLNPLDMDDWREELPDMPDTAVKFLSKKNGQDKAEADRLDATAILTGVPEGERDNTLFRYACRLRGKGLNLHEAEALVMLAAGACNPPFPREQAMKCLKQAWGFEPNEESKPAIEIISVAEIMDLNPQIEHIAEGFLNRGEPMIIHAAGGIGKSTISQQIAYELARPVDMLGNMLLDTFPIRQAGCQSLFIQSENTMAAVNVKAAGWEPEVASRIFFPKLFNDVLTTGESFEDRKFIQRVVDTIRLIEDKTGKRLDLLFVDPLISFHRAEENGAGDMRAALDGITRVSQETSVTPIVLHHDNRADSYRGSSAINDWCRTRVHMVQAWIGEGRVTGFAADDKPITRTAKIPAVEIHHKKANNMPTFESFTMVLSRRMQFKKIDDPIDPAVMERGLEVQQALKDLGGVAKSNHVLAKAISELTGRGVTTCKKDIAEAVKHGVILAETTKGPDGRSNAYSYVLTD